MSGQMKPWTQAIDYAMLERIKFLGLPQVKEKNEWLVLHIKGDGIKAPESWNAKVYTNKAEELKLVVTDVDIFNDLMMGRKVRAMEQVTCKAQEHCVDCAPRKAAECEVSSMESRRIISIDDSGWGCETDDAEVLTKRGWLSCYDIKKDDYVISYRDDGVIRWSPLLNIEIHPFDGRINQFKHRRILIRVTPDHHMKILKRVFKGNAIKHTSKLTGFQTEYIHVSDLKSNDRIPQTGKWIGTDMEYFILPSIKQVKHDSFSRGPVSIRMNDWLAFFGLWLAEGGQLKVVNKQGNGADYRVNLWQNVGTETADRIRETLRRLPFSFGETTRKTVRLGIDNEQAVFTIHNKQLYMYLKQFGNTYNKYIPRDILDLPPERLNVLIKHMLYGDGNLCHTHNGKSSHRRYYTSSPKLRDCLQEVIVKTGHSFNTRVKNNKKCTCDNFDININNTKWCVVGNLEYTSPHYKGNVFDLSVADDRSFLVRREGKSYFTGNCPVGGTLVGFHDSLTGKFLFREVPVSAYQGYAFDSKAYLRIATDKAVEMLVELFQRTAPSMEEDKCKAPHILIKVCTGYVNTGIVKELRERGFKVETCAIGEPLQSALEKQHREYIKRLTNADVYYDPKDLGKSNIGLAYSDAVEWIEKNNAWDIAKTGWKSMKKLRLEVA